MKWSDKQLKSVKNKTKQDIFQINIPRYFKKGKIIKDRNVSDRKKQQQKKKQNKKTTTTVF